MCDLVRMIMFFFIWVILLLIYDKVNEIQKEVKKQ